MIGRFICASKYGREQYFQLVHTEAHWYAILFIAAGAVAAAYLALLKFKAIITISVVILQKKAAWCNAEMQSPRPHSMNVNVMRTVQ